VKTDLSQEEAPDTQKSAGKAERNIILNPKNSRIVETLTFQRPRTKPIRWHPARARPHFWHTLAIATLQDN
jgi:hypothetical protein